MSDNSLENDLECGSVDAFRLAVLDYLRRERDYVDADISAHNELAPDEDCAMHPPIVETL